MLYFYPSPRPIPFPKNSIQAAQWREWIQIQNHAWKFPPPHTLHTPQRKIDGKTTERTQCFMNELHPAPHSNSISKINTENPIPAAQWMETIKIQNRAWEFPPPQTLYTPQRKIDGKTTEKTTQCPMNETHPAPHRRTIRKITTENGEPESREF